MSKINIKKNKEDKKKSPVNTFQGKPKLSSPFKAEDKKATDIKKSSEKAKPKSAKQDK